MKAWAVVPARGGSKSIPYKNLAIVAGRPLLDYGVGATLASNRFERIIVSTDDARIAARARLLGVEIDRRGADLATDDSPVTDVVVDLLRRLGGADGADLPDVIVLIQPTSPFLLPEHINGLLRAMESDPTAMSGQTVTRCAHNQHAWNQRELKDGKVTFRFAEDRRAAYDKQRKPELYLFGNLIATLSSALLREHWFFAEPSLAFEIPGPYSFDLDTAEDVAIAEALIASDCVTLRHMPALGQHPAEQFGIRSQA